MCASFRTFRPYPDMRPIQRNPERRSLIDDADTKGRAEPVGCVDEIFRGIRFQQQTLSAACPSAQGTYQIFVK